MPDFNPAVKNGLSSVSEGKIFWTEHNKVTCSVHGACLCLNRNRTIWRCPACNEGAYVIWIQREICPNCGKIFIPEVEGGKELDGKWFDLDCYWTLDLPELRTKLINGS